MFASKSIQLFSWSAVLSAIIILASCGSQKPFIAKHYQNWAEATAQDSAMEMQVILVGDAGEPVLDGKDPVLEMLKWHLKFTGNKLSKSSHLNDNNPSSPQPKKQAFPFTTVAFLGDNIYESGLPPASDPDRKLMERKINMQLDAVQESGGRSLFIPGNHDWNHSTEGGLEQVIRQQEYIENYLKSEQVFAPGGGCAGPVAINLSDKLVLIAIDSEWWLTNEARSEAPDSGCSTESEFDFLIRLEDMLDEYEEQNVVLLMHHPLFSNSNHGGHYSLADNIFPLRLINPKWMLPLPIIGSVYPLLRKYGVSRQDIPHPKYQELKKGLLEVLEDRSNVIVASGHDHNLQLKIHQHIPFIVSGSASKVNFVARGRKADFTHQSKGFSKLNYHRNGEVWLEFWQPTTERQQGKLTFKTLLYTFEKDTLQAVLSNRVDYQDSTKLLAAGKEYEASGFKKLWLGTHYRKEWTTPIMLNYLDVETEQGGLLPLQKGGGKQTISLRLQDQNNVQYTMRSVNKNPKGAIPKPLHGTFAESLVRDQISSAHPYGALVIPSLAEAANVYHTSPKLFYVPNDPGLGRFRHEFAEMMVLLEIRPDEDLSQYRRFGYSKNVVSTKTVQQKLREDNDNEVDQHHFLRSRLFDMIIGDWDRHQDQWRWAEFEKEGKGSIYQAVPRDRDQVFTKFDGIIPWLASRKWTQRSLSHFDYTFNDIIGLNFSAERLDRRFLNELDWDQWVKEARTLKDSLTDKVIDHAVKQIPDAIYRISGKEIANKLKSRRDNLLKALDRYYLALSKEIDITGSEKHEYFLVNRLESGQSEVKIFKTWKDGAIDNLIFSRVFHPTETKEIRLFTLGGQDSVVVTGEVNHAIKLRIIGGNDQNTIIDSSAGAKVIVYENTLEDNKIISGKRTKVTASDQEYINDYDPDEFQYGYLGPRISIERNTDDGFYLGGGVYWNNYGFRRKPYKSEHLVLAHVATATGGFDFRYDGTYYSLFGRNWDLAIKAQTFGPKYVFNYFNQGNGTIQENEDINFYRIRFNHIGFSPSVNYRFNQVVKFGIGPTFKYYDVISRPNNITTSDDFDSPEDLVSSYFAGTRVFLDLNLLDHPAYPRRGIKWYSEWSYQSELNGSDNFHKLRSDLSFYVTPNIPLSMTLAVRFGVDANLGNYKFYQSNFLGGTENLRGYRKTRFAGKTAAYQNTELRIGLSSIRNYFFTGYWGILAFVDHGRIWTDGQGMTSSKWKRGYGPGVWMNLFKNFTLSMEYGISKEDQIFSIKFGLQY